MSNVEGHDRSRGPRRYGPSSQGRPGYEGRRPPGGPRHEPRRPGASHRGGNWSDVGGPAWADADRPTDEFLPVEDDRPPRRSAGGGGGARYGGPPPPPPGPPGPPRRPERRRRPAGGLVIGRIIAGIVATALVLVIGTTWALLSGDTKTASDANERAGNVGVVTETTDANGNVIPIPIKGTNILIVGADSRTDANGNPLTKAEQKQVGVTLDGGGVNTDTIMILHIPEGGGQSTAVSIPRDTWMGEDVVGAPGVVGAYSDGTEGPYKPNKINSFYSSAKAYELEYLVSKGVTDQAERQRKSNEAGRTMLIRVLQQFTGLKINHYAEVNLLGFYLLSKAIGGVPVCLRHAVKDPDSGADFPAGHFEVEGKSALAFVRQRHGLPQQDLDRIKRQQAFLAGAVNKILSLGTLTDPGELKDLVDAANRSLVLDKGFNLLSFAQQMVGMSSGDINFVTLPTHGAQPGVNTDALATDPAEVRSFFAGLSDGSNSSSSSSSSQAPDTTVDPSSVTVDVQNGTETSGMAAAVGSVVAAAGFERGQLSDYPGTTSDNQQETTTVRYPPGGEAAAEQVLKAIGTGKTVADDSVADGHILVVVGTDMPRPDSSSSTGPAGFRGSNPAVIVPAVRTRAPAAVQSAATVMSLAFAADGAINAADPGCVN